MSDDPLVATAGRCNQGSALCPAALAGPLGADLGGLCALIIDALQMDAMRWRARQVLIFASAIILGFAEMAFLISKESQLQSGDCFRQDMLSSFSLIIPSLMRWDMFMSIGLLSIIEHQANARLAIIAVLN